MSQAEQDIRERARLLIANAPTECTDGGDYSVCRAVIVDDMALVDQILSLPIRRERVCPECKGRKKICKGRYGATTWKITEQDCPTCNGTGELPERTITLKEAIERCKDGQA